MESKEIYKKLDGINDLPTLPAIAMEVNNMLEDYNTSMKDLSNTIEKDQSIASKILKLVNSAFFGLSSKVNNIPHAMTLLGFNTVRNAVVSVSIINSFTKKSDMMEFDIKDFWTHSVGVAVTSRHIAENSKIAASDNSFIGGLLHDMGKIVLAQYFPDLFINAWTLSKESELTFYNAEKQENPIDHARIGGYLAKRWKLPLTLTDTIRYHHSMSKNAQDINLLMVIHFADAIYNSYQKLSEYKPDLSIDIQNTLITSYLNTASEWFPRLLEDIEAACKFFLEDLE